jgi:hypothetical protein
VLSDWFVRRLEKCGRNFKLVCGTFRWFFIL